MKLQEQISKMKSMMGLQNQTQKTKPISRSSLRTTKITPQVIQNNNTLLSQIQQSQIGDKVDLNTLDPNKNDFISQLSQRLQDKGFEPFLYQYRDDESGEGMVSGGLTFYIPNTDIGVSYEPGTFGASLGNLGLSYTPSTKEISANLIIPIGK